ncbi:MAG: sulfur carrier protein ThiS [Promethearchaeota archaeon]
MIKCRVNNRDFSYAGGEPLTVSRLFEIQNYMFPDIIVKINSVYISPEAYANTLIQDGDDVLALHIFGGG